MLGVRWKSCKERRKESRGEDEAGRDGDRREGGLHSQNGNTKMLPSKKLSLGEDKLLGSNDSPEAQLNLCQKGGASERSCLW